MVDHKYSIEGTHTTVAQEIRLRAEQKWDRTVKIPDMKQLRIDQI